MSATNTEFFDAIKAIEVEYGIPQEYMLEKIRAALLTALKQTGKRGEDGRPDMKQETLPKLPNGEDSALVDDLGLSSLDVINIVAAFEDEFGIEVPDRVIPTLRTVKDITEYLEKNVE